ncbi:hypothetical protein [Actinoplanes sp. URMC 104]|uniref:hypothetical protein n=1 Tax=Actinoplanes sp. URMC 104 TaxID=3423409 RepID=UPI003F1A137A
MGGLSACRSEPSVAAYVGDSARITEARVQQVWDNAYSALTAAAAEQPAQPQQPEGSQAEPGTGPSDAPVTMPITRTDIVRTLVGHDVLADVAQREGVTLPSNLPLGDYATQLRLPQNAEYVRLYAEFDGLIRGLRSKVQSNAPAATDDDLRQVFDVLVEQGEVPGNTTFEQFKTQLPAENLQLVKTAAAVRQEVAELTDKMDITVNPRYQPLGIPVLEFQTQQGELRPLVVVPLGEDETSNPVTDVS